MPKKLPEMLFALGLVAVVWVAAVHAASNPAVLGICLLIALVYAFGGIDLRRYRKASASLLAATKGLEAPPADLEAWLRPLDPSLRTAVRLRIAGERTALPAPLLPAYLSGVLVLLGMLGTLLGMMATLRGTGLALETATDLQAIRDSLAAPVKGLGYAFGTSIAGIASSAVLGVLAALCRRERMQAARDLDACIAGPLQVFGREHRRDAVWQLLQAQGALLPQLVERLQTLADAVERRDEAAQAQQLARQEMFLARSEAAYVQLADGVRQALQDSVAQGAEAARGALQPMLQATLKEIAGSAHTMHAQLDAAVQAHLREATDGLQQATATIAGRWTQALEQQQQANAAQLVELHAAFAQAGAAQAERSETLAETLAGQMQAATTAAVSAWAAAQARLHAAQVAQQQEQQARQDAQDTRRLQAWQEALIEQGAALRAQWVQAAEASAQQQKLVCDALQASAAGISEQGRRHADETLAEVGKLLQAASEAPRAAAEVIGELRQSLSDSLQRDAAMLAERNQLLATLGGLLETLDHAAGEQRLAIDALVGNAGALLEQAGARFDARIEADAQRLDVAATRATAGALEIAGIGDAFGSAVEAFAGSSEQLAERLERLEGALEKSLLRSDEQLAYYVAQAREVVELSQMTQRQLVDDLRQLAGQRDAAAVDAA